VLSKTIALYGRVDLLGLDELGLHGAGPARRRAAVPGPDLREETNSIAIASDESFSGWTKTFTGPRPCAAIADRLAQCEVLLDPGGVLDDDDTLFAVPQGWLLTGPVLLERTSDEPDSAPSVGAHSTGGGRDDPGSVGLAPAASGVKRSPGS